MKYVLIVTLSLLAGVLGGVLSQRPQLGRAEQRIEELQQRDCAPRRGVGRGLAAAMQGQPAGMLDPDGADGRGEFPLDDFGDRDGGDGTAEVDTGTPVKGGGEEDGAADTDDGMELAALLAAQDLRRAQARAALIEQADPTDSELARFDAAVEAMNKDLLELSRKFVDGIENIDDVERRDLMVFAADMLDVMITAEDGVYDALGDIDLDQVDDEAYDPFSHLDPAIIEVVMQLEGLDAP